MPYSPLRCADAISTHYETELLGIETVTINAVLCVATQQQHELRERANLFREWIRNKEVVKTHQRKSFSLE
jgi:hypothetical protein